MAVKGEDAAYHGCGSAIYITTWSISLHAHQIEYFLSLFSRFGTQHTHLLPITTYIGGRRIGYSAASVLI
jgi:hypothetical protein